MRSPRWFAIAAALASVSACGSDAGELPTSEDGPAPFDPDTPYEPQIDADELSPEIDNSLLPWPVGARWVYEAETDEGVERIEITVDAEPRAVFGASARVVRDTVFLGDEMIEDTFDWYAQDPDGNVWYL